MIFESINLHFSKICHFAWTYAIIDFHHPPGTKTYGVNELVAKRKFAKVYEEIKKCVVLCANCHRIHHYDEKGAVAPHISAN